MNNRLNYSSLEDAWGFKNLNNESEQITLDKQFNQNPEIKYNSKYKKPTENILTIGSNEVVKPIVESYHPVSTSKGSIIKPCSLVEDHISKCESCRNKLNYQKVEEFNNNHNTTEYFSETLSNVTPNQKNLLVIILYGILVILISDLIIKDRDE